MAKLQMSFDFANDSLQNSTSEANEIASTNHLNSGDTRCFDVKESLKIFENPEFGRVRACLINGEPWFVGRDIAEVLKYAYPKDAVRDNVDAEDKTIAQLSDFQEGERGSLPDHMKGSKIVIINESGLYSLILRSNKEEAKAFKRWITSEVLPSIRKTGKYEVNLQPQLPQTYIEALEALLASEKEKERLRLENESKQKTIEEQAPKVGYYDELVERGNNTNIRDTAGELGMRQNEFVQLMITWGILYRDKKRQLKPTAEAKEKGLCVLKEYTSQTNGHTGNQTMFTVEGKNYIRRRRLKA